MGKFKKCILLLLTMITTMSLTLSAYAEISITPRWNYIITVNGNLEIDSKGFATANVTCGANSDSINKLVITTELQRLDGKWETIKSWTVTENYYISRFSKEYSVYKNYSYRLKITAKAYSGVVLMETVTENFDYGYYN